MALSGKVPGALSKALNEENMKLILAGADQSEFELWAVHPGGRSILDAVQNSVGLDPQLLATSRCVLENYGNMSSATVLFVLAEKMRSGVRSGQRGCALAFGPGLTAETMLFSAV